MGALRGVDEVTRPKYDHRTLPQDRRSFADWEFLTPSFELRSSFYGVAVRNFAAYRSIPSRTIRIASTLCFHPTVCTRLPSRSL